MNFLKHRPVLICVATCLMAGVTQANGTWGDNCPGGARGGAFVGPGVSPGPCIIAFPAGPGAPATATPTIENTMGGLDFFTTGIGIIYDTSSLDQHQGAVYSTTVIAPVTWDPNVKMVPTFLGLDGQVQIPDPSGSLNILLTGLLGGPIQFINITLTHANCAQCTLAIPNYSMQAPAATATEVLTLNSIGRVVYRTGTDTFVGSVPEPGTLALLLAGLCPMLIGLGMSLRARRVVPSSTRASGPCE